MAKYQIKERTKYSAIPVIELVGGATGIIRHVGVCYGVSAIHIPTGKNCETVFYLKDWSYELEDIPPELASCSDRDLEKIVSKASVKLDIEELKEIRDLEKKYRDTLKK